VDSKPPPRPAWCRERTHRQHRLGRRADDHPDLALAHKTAAADAVDAQRASVSAARSHRCRASWSGLRGHRPGRSGRPSRTAPTGLEMNVIRLHPVRARRAGGAPPHPFDRRRDTIIETKRNVITVQSPPHKDHSAASSGRSRSTAQARRDAHHVARGGVTTRRQFQLSPTARRRRRLRRLRDGATAADILSFAAPKHGPEPHLGAHRRAPSCVSRGGLRAGDRRVPGRSAKVRGNAPLLTPETSRAIARTCRLTSSRPFVAETCGGSQDTHDRRPGELANHDGSQLTAARTARHSRGRDQ